MCKKNEPSPTSTKYTLQPPDGMLKNVLIKLDEHEIYQLCFSQQFSIPKTFPPLFPSKKLGGSKYQLFGAGNANHLLEKIIKQKVLKGSNEHYVLLHRRLDISDIDGQHLVSLHEDYTSRIKLWHYLVQFFKFFIYVF